MFIIKNFGGRYYIHRYGLKFRELENSLENTSQVNGIEIRSLKYANNLGKFNEDIAYKNFGKDHWKYKVWFDRESLDILKKKNQVTRIFYQKNLKTAFLIRIIKKEKKYYSLRAVIPSIEESLNITLELTIIVLIGVMLITLGISIIFFNKINKKIITINNNLENIVINKFENIVVASGNDEFSDISNKIKIISKQLKKQIITLENNLEKQKFFLRNLGHELKTPLTIANGYCEIIREKNKINSKNSCKLIEVKYIDEELKRISKLIRRFNELSLNSSNIFIENINIKELLEEISSRFIYGNKEIKYLTDLDNLNLNCDVELLESMIYNLYSNAFSYSHSTIEVKLVNKNGIKSLIISNDIISKNLNLDNIWDPFYRGTKNKVKYGGHGLGLAIVEEIINVHNWKIKAEIINDKIKFTVYF